MVKTVSCKWWLLPVVLLTHCTPHLRTATDAQAAVTGVVLRVARVNAHTGGVLHLVNTGRSPYLVTRPAPCSAYLTLYNAQRQRIKPNEWVKRPCPPSGGPVLLAPGDSIGYALPVPQAKHDEQELRKARSFEVVYYGHIWPSHQSKRAQRVMEYQLKFVGIVE